MRKRKVVAVIGGGIAGMEAAAYLSAIRYDVILIEKNKELGGHLLQWERLFPTKRLGKEVLSFLSQGINKNIRIYTNTTVNNVERKDNIFTLLLSNGEQCIADAVLLTTGYDIFNARKKEEYGYGIYDNVITSADLEEIFSNGKEIKTHQGKTPKRIGFIHCVGSRDEKVGNVYCSKVCCVTGVKQAIEVKERLPEAEMFSFYMDLRMFDMKFEELYKEAQEKWGINFVRGRLSEASENIDGSIVVKVEDTLAGKPLKMTVDLLVLLVGFVPSEGTKAMGKLLNINFGSNGFVKPADEHTSTNATNIPGVFVAGTCTAPRTITNTILDARSAVLKVTTYLEKHDLAKRTSTINQN